MSNQNIPYNQVEGYYDKKEKEKKEKNERKELKNLSKNILKNPKTNNKKKSKQKFQKVVGYLTVKDMEDFKKSFVKEGLAALKAKQKFRKTKEQ